MADMRIDQLAQRAGVPSRTIRYYTQQGLLPPPVLRGRVGFYDDSHLDRLKLIKELQEKRFLPLNVIRSVLKRAEEGYDLETMLAPLDMVFAPRWDSSLRAELTRAELAERAGVESSVVDTAEEMGFLFPRKHSREVSYTYDDVLMLEVAADWIKLGLPHELARLYRRSLEQISKIQVRAFNECVVAPLVDKHLQPEELRQELVEGYKQMARIFNRVVGLLHRKLLQKAVESHASEE